MNAQANDSDEKARQLCDRLYLAAKTSQNRRFHALYDKVYRKDFLENAWKQVKGNGGSAGIDGETISDILIKGPDNVLNELLETLEEGKYRPKSVKRVYIPKPDGRQRPLGIPTVRDRIVQAATKSLIEPIFEADFLDCSYGFRPNRSAHDAMETIRKANNAGFLFVLDADICQRQLNNPQLWQLNFPQFYKYLTPPSRGAGKVCPLSVSISVGSSLL